MSNEPKAAAADAGRDGNAASTVQNVDIPDAKLEDVSGGHMRGNITRRRSYDSLSTSAELF
ncbi:hypothetical protein W911_08120 [Hyphomicrobium nitrativorans NL23]|uniref:Uncharacterized protein n=1 Tax=Hyphomicrobium nitrativorans NL23 TaxID=1029756 RepID=V5SHT7_9HYPH|nr:hypothetical protein [Hyphomicrobium nitrativorans]AHB50103.1 hypothetical protein W911_08120 [Hyphomicrobium nitrativorans NL23]